MIGRAYIGTSGWSYTSWEKAFYPERLPKTRHFEFYATQFPTVEINLTFYRLPTLKMVERWRDQTPAGFLFAIKGSRFITHMKKLLNPKDALQEFFRCLRPLQRRIGIVLWQLPPFLGKDLPRLESFLKQLPKSYDYAVEFRHPSWLSTDVFALLRRHRIAHVSVSSRGMPMDLTVTSEVVYVRFHGLDAGAAHDYTVPELEPWAEHVRRQIKLCKRAFVYFNNDVHARAPANARTFMQMIDHAEHPSAP
ncbi:MAG TPA: DUF72 domain-containing protein [Verrucomicrobiae bacterium]|nr:DUF72 domain-containing protein [Verrucomicrobiae bacterium]